MKTLKVITHVERSLAYAEGRKAFDQREQRCYNPYAATKQELAMAWWHGWDTAQEESEGDTKPGSNQP
jgi:hypothetical protein